MTSRIEFDHVITHLDKYEVDIENYLLHQEEWKLPNEAASQFIAYHEPPFHVKPPGICTWEFMDQESLKELLCIERKSDIRKYINSNINKDQPKGKSRTLFVELMYNVMKFSKAANYNLEKTGALLSQFYLIHLFFTSRLDMSADKVYAYFKELVLCHSVPFPPNACKLFSHKESKEIMELFCKLYLRNLPLIRFLSLPNFAFAVNYELEPEPVVSRKSKWDKSEKSKTGSEKSKKGSKPGSGKGSEKRSKK